MLKEFKGMFNEVRVLDLEEGSNLEVRKGMYIDFPNGEELKLEEGERVKLLRKLSPDWEWTVKGKRTRAVSIGIGERTATVGVDYVKPLSRRNKNKEYVTE